MLFPPTPPREIQTVEKGHGRIETRTLKLLPVQGHQINFPFAAQVYSIERNIFTLSTGKTTIENIVGITSITQFAAGPERILSLNRDHWVIENKVHYVRDVSMSEDASRIRKGEGPRMMAIFRNLTLSFLRVAGISNIADKMLSFLLDKNSLFKFLNIRNAIKN